jgi:hypothetical protein
MRRMPGCSASQMLTVRDSRCPARGDVTYLLHGAMFTKPPPLSRWLRSRPCSRWVAPRGSSRVTARNSRPRTDVWGIAVVPPCGATKGRGYREPGNAVRLRLMGPPE